ncbi:hypothetical protein [Streptomyces sp. NBC_00083]|uniref:hypothetical protein n=1 Tax=Streptomyces sp. NBC_00083 TaxID=2975647 RepID=UPI0022504B3C|nr:hypothetical protein [Streptomyces sp. NBC_00083]MCX5382728.1 hypothetical protein [Streptomyces sp. NBC_00083]
MTHSTAGSSTDHGPRADEVDTLTLALGVTDYRRTHLGFTTSAEHVNHVRLPSRFAPEDIRRALRDYELLADTLRTHPVEMAELLEAHARKDGAASRAVAARLGISEESFEAEGGGIVWGVVVAVIVCDVFTGCFTGGFV